MGLVLTIPFELNISVIQCLKVKYLTMNVQRLRQERWGISTSGWGGGGGD